MYSEVLSTVWLVRQCVLPASGLTNEEPGAEPGAGPGSDRAQCAALIVHRTGTEPTPDVRFGSASFIKASNCPESDTRSGSEPDRCEVQMNPGSDLEGRDRLLLLFTLHSELSL